MLQEELSGIENKIAYARQFYNDTVMRMNQNIEMFPGNIIASIFGFKSRNYFQVTETERKVVKVKF
jgi:LemA protein